MAQTTDGVVVIDLGELVAELQQSLGDVDAAEMQNGRWSEDADTDDIGARR
jgi:hypothetical protein